MRHTLFFMVFVFSTFFLGSCKTIKTKNNTSNATTATMIRSYNNHLFSKETIQAKIKAHFESPKMSQNISIKLRMKKDEVIWMSVSFIGFPVAKLKITPESVQFYEKIKHTYFEGDFGFISKHLGVDINFKQLQNLLLGQSINPISEKDDIVKQGDEYKIIPYRQEALYDLFYWLNTTNFKLNKQQINSDKEKQELLVEYPSYQFLMQEFFPEVVKITVSDSKQTSLIEMQYRHVEFNQNLEFPFHIPEGYKRINL